MSVTLVKQEKAIRSLAPICLAIVLLIMRSGPAFSREADSQVDRKEYHPTLSDTPETLDLPGQKQILDRYGVEPWPDPGEDNWIDDTQFYLSRTVQKPVTWFDRFFGSDLSDEAGYASTFIRIRFPATWTEEGGFDSRPEFKAQVYLPRATRKLRLIIANDNDLDPLDEPSGPPAAGEQQPQGNIALRYDVKKTAKSRVSFSAGARSGPDLYVRARYRFLTSISTHSRFRLTQTLWYLLDAKGEGETRVDLEGDLDPFTLLRWTNSGFYTQEEIDVLGIQWSSDLFLATALSKRAGLLYSLGASGVTKPNTFVTDYNVLTRYRRNFFRSWLFYEIEPSLSWIRDEFGEFKPVGSMTLRLEIQLGWQKTG